jgi:prenyltransferase beta subunit
VKTALAFACLLLLSPAAHGPSADEKKATIAYLQGLQAKDGGFRADARAAASSLGATTAALRALGYFGGKASDRTACKAFVLACRDRKTGGFANAPGGKPDVVLTAVGLMALKELKVPTGPYEKAAVAFLAEGAKTFEEVRMAAAGLEAVGKRCAKNEAWLDQLARRRNADGTFGKGQALPRETGSAVAAVLRLGGKVAKPGAVVRALDAGQRGDGGFGLADALGSDLATSYRVVRTYHMLKAKPGRPAALKAFIARCRKPGGGYGVTPDAPAGASGTYYAAILLHWLSEK